MRTPLIVLAVLCFIPSWASEPGQPLGCSDWVFNEPGLACEVDIPPPCMNESSALLPAAIS